MKLPASCHASSAVFWLRLNPWCGVLFMAVGKFARYGLIVLAMSYPLSK